MDWNSPKYDLQEVKRLIREGQCRITITALQFGNELGFSGTEIKDVVLGLAKGDFQKSTSEIRNNRVRQDVYRKEARGIDLYIKLKIAQGEERGILILSFKEYGDTRMKP